MGAVSVTPEIGEEHVGVGDKPRASAILMHPGTHIEARSLIRRHIRNVPICFPVIDQNKVMCMSWIFWAMQIWTVDVLSLSQEFTHKSDRKTTYICCFCPAQSTATGLTSMHVKSKC